MTTRPRNGRRNRSQDPEAIALGQQLRMLRQERGWTQADLAQRIGVRNTIVGYYERGEHYPPFPMLKKLAVAFGVSLDVLGGTGSEAPDRFQDRELLQWFLLADKLDHRTRSTIKDVLEGMLARADSGRVKRHIEASR